MKPGVPIAAATLATAIIGACATVAAGAPASDGSAHAAAASHKAGAASAKAGSGLGSINIEADATGVRAPLYSSGGEDVEGEVPYSTSTMQSGQNGSATTSIFWPGSTGAAGGTTIYLLGPQCVPPQPPGVLPIPVPLPNLPCPTTLPQGPQSIYDALNDPEKASAETGSGKSVDERSNGDLTQKAVAKPADVSAATSLKGSKVPALGEVFGDTSSSTSIKVSGPRTTTVTADSVAHNASIAGVLKIGAVTSIAKAQSNTVHATGSVKTTIAGASVAGVPIKIDRSGIHIKGVGSKLPALTKTVNTALKKAGISIYMSKSSKSIHKGNVTLTAGNLIILEKNPEYTKNANDTGTLLVLGGANITSQTAKAYVPPPYTSSPTPTTSTPKPPATTSSKPTKTHGPAPVNSGGGGPINTGGGGPVPTGGSVVPNPGGRPSVAPPAVAVAASSPIHLLRGFGLVWLILGLAGAGGLAFGLKRLPDRLLETPTTICAQEDPA